MIELSLNEVETLSMKVARGSGYSWGLAEDIGRAARVLAVAGISWPDAILELVDGADKRVPPSFSDDGETVRIVVGEASLCPIRTAAWLIDADALQNPASLRIERVALPIWLAAMTTRGNVPQATVFTWPAAAVTVTSDTFVGSGSGLLASQADVVLRTGTTPVGQPTEKRRAFIHQSALIALDAIAAKTYVPASEGSRSKGAGGSRTDDE